MSNADTVVSADAAPVTLARGSCSVTIVSCPLTRFGRARAMVVNGESTLGFTCRLRDLELLARVLQWRPAASDSDAGKNA